MLDNAEFLNASQRLRAVMQPDPHAGEDGTYEIRSLYFDNLYDKALMEKINGVSRRDKFRIRYYNGDTSLSHLEKKCKRGDLSFKESAVVTLHEVRLLMNGVTDWMESVSDRPVVQELYSKMQTEGLKPKTLVDYTRIPFVYAPGNVRVTLDYNIRTGLGSTDFLNPDCITVPAGYPFILMEVKWDEYLPDIIKDCVALGHIQQNAFSKYSQCRIYG